MDPAEWEQQADRNAAELGASVSQIESEFWPEPPGGTFRQFWPRVKDLNERVRTAPAIKLDDKLQLQHRLNELCHRARIDQKRLQDEREAAERELRDALQLARENVSEATTLDQVQEARSELTLVRERIEAETRRHPGRHNQPVWQEWHDTNQAAWNRLNELWAANEAYLSAILDEAERRASEGDVRAAKDDIKRFHAEVSTHECSHRALRTLRTRSNELWQQADQVGKEKHERYLDQASKRVGYWRGLLNRHARARATVMQEIAQLERQMASANTDVGAALMRGQLEERRKALAHMDAEDRELQQRIEAAELALNQR